MEAPKYVRHSCISYAGELENLLELSISQTPHPHCFEVSYATPVTGSGMGRDNICSIDLPF